MDRPVISGAVRLSKASLLSLGLICWGLKASARSRTETGFQVSYLLDLRQSGCPSSSVVKNPPANAEDLSSIPGSGRSPGVENGNPLQYSCLVKSHKQRGLAGYSPWGCKEADTT